MEEAGTNTEVETIKMLEGHRRERSGLPNYSSVSIINKNFADLVLFAA